MVQIVWTRQALKNLKEIKDYVSQGSTYYAERLINQIYDGVQVLINHPESGMVDQTEKARVLRRLIIKTYRIIYLYHKDVVQIIAVYHQSRNDIDPFDSKNL